jgi:hypothetical protein
VQKESSHWVLTEADIIFIIRQLPRVDSSNKGDVISYDWRFKIMQQNAEKSLPAWANPGALGFIALAVILFSLAPILCRWVSPTSFPLTAAWGAIALVALVIVTIIFFRNREIMLGTAFGVLGVLLSGGLAFKAVQLTMFASNLVGLSPEMIAGGTVVDSMVWIVIGVVLVPIGYLAGYISSPFAILVWLADVGVWMLAAVGFGTVQPMVAVVGGYFIFILGTWFLYMGMATLVNGTLNKPVMSVGRPLLKIIEMLVFRMLLSVS